MNLNAQDATRTTLGKPTDAYIRCYKRCFPQNTSEIYNRIIT